MALDYRKRKYIIRDIVRCKSDENTHGRGVEISHQQFGEMEIPENVMLDLCQSYLTEHGYTVTKDDNPLGGG